MGVQIEELRAYFTANYAGYLKGVNAVKDAASNLEKIASQAARKISAAFEASQDKLKAFGEQSQKIGRTANDAFNRISLAAAGILIPAIKKAADAGEELSKFDAVFKSYAKSTGQFADDLAKQVNRSSLEIKENMSSLQGFFVGLGFEAEQSLKLTQKLSEAAVDFGSFNNLSDEESFSRFISALSGSSEVLDRFGINIKAVAIDQELLRMGINATTATASEQDKTLARINIILQSMGAQGALGAAAHTSGSFSNQLKGMLAALGDLQVRIGQAVIPELTKLIRIFHDNKDRLAELAVGFGQFISQIIQFGLQHPQMVKVLAVFKAFSALGLNNLLTTLASSLGNLGLSLAGIAAKAGMAQSAMVGLRAVSWAAIITVVAALAWEFTGASKAIAEYNAQIERSRNLSAQMSGIQDKKTQGVLNQALLEGGDKGRATLQAAYDQQQKEIAGLEASIRGQRSIVHDRDTLWSGAAEAVGFGTAHSEEAANLTDLEKKLEEARKRAEQLKTAMQEMGDASSQAAAQAGASVQPVTEPAFAVGDGSETAQRVRDAQQAAIEASNPGYKGFQEILQGGATGEQLQAYLEATGNGSVSESNAAWDAKSELNDINASGGFSSQEQIDAFAQKIAAASNAAAEAEQQRLDTLEQEKQRIAEIPNVLKSVEEATLDIKSQLSLLDEETAGPLAGALENIRGRFETGKMSADDFTAAMQGLKSATDQATAAAKREEEQKLREQILRGDFSGLNPMQALEDKLFQFRMQQFNGGIDAMFNQMMGLGQVIRPVSSGFGQLATQMQNFGDQLNGAMQPGGGGNNAGSAIFSWLNSLDGIASSLYNNISMLQQSLQFIQDPRRRQDVFDQIDAMQNQLNNLYQTPYTVGDAFDNIQDPGIGGGNSISVSLPNVSRVTNADVRMLTDAIARELDQRGRRY